MELNLDAIREKINAIDEKLVALFEERMETVSEVAAYKKQHNMKVLDSSREKEVITRAVSRLHNKDLETYVEIPSDKIAFDKAPKMKAMEITDKSIELLKSGKYKFGRINFPNGDMVGHSGIIEAAIEAVEIVDKSVGRLIETVNELGGITVVTADHGNADEMFTEKNGVRTVKTAHTLNPVPFVIIDSGYKGEYEMANVENPGLTNIASTLLNLLGFEKVEDYDSSLITIK